MFIRVTELDIRTGRPGQGDQCPVAIALKSAGILNAVVTAGGLVYNGTEAIGRLPSKAEYRVRDYDFGRGMEPFEFDLEVDEPLGN